MPATQKTPTIQDVARIAGVSTATVSRVLSAPDIVRARTRERVHDAIETIGFTPNIAAQSLRRRKVRTVLVALPNIGNSFFGPIVDAIERTCVERDYDVLIVNRRPESEDDSSLLTYFSSNRADGLLLFDGNAAQSNWTARVGNRELLFPTVNVCECIEGAGLPTVLSDNEGGVEIAIDHLVTKGHRRIGRVAGPVENVLNRQRGAGYSRALKRHGIEARGLWSVSGPFGFQTGREAADRFVELNDRPTAVFCDADEIAIGFISGLRSRGVSCPDDVSVIGFDDIPFAAQTSPPLTTIRQRHKELGRLSAELLMDMLDGRMKEVASHVVLPCELVERQTVRPISED
ncbi:MAG: LacI family DNA-binding transcriptional regulator [Hyphomicrobiaceae bacterium]|nr:LacI family DNA-binding transcriptional regulator [Hyphomicrobiaceae bacterium]